MKKRILIWALGVAVMPVLIACFMAASREPQTGLMRRMEDAGAGDMRSVTRESIEQWFQQHPKVALEISRSCRSLKREAPAKWGDTTDGRICAAAATVHVFYYQFRPVDGMALDEDK